MSLPPKLVQSLRYYDKYKKKERKEWLRSLYFVDIDQQIYTPSHPTTTLRSDAQSATSLFIDSIEKELNRRRAADRDKILPAIRTHCTGPKLKKQYEWWLENVFYGNQTYNPKKTPAAVRKIIKVYDDIVQERKKHLEFYQLVAPHTFCFIPPEQLRSPLESLIHQQGGLSTQEYDYSSNWYRTPWIRLVNNKSHRASVQIMFRKGTPLMKVKYTTHNYSQQENDKLDVEFLIKGRSIQDICHYHVEKEATFNLLQSANASYKTSHSLFSLSRNISDDSIRYELDDQQHMASHDIYKQYAVVSQMWGHNPIMVGGSLLEQTLKVICAEPKFETLQFHHAKK